jgi:hypothetical protein
MESSIKKAIRKKLEQLTPENLQEVLVFVSARSGGKESDDSPRRLLQFAGCIDPSDLDLMLQAIENGCENIDAREW